MSFYATYNRIRANDGAAKVFDTEQPMPHILQTLTVNGVGVTFPNSGSEGKEDHYTNIESSYESVCRSRQKCGFRQWCRNEMDCGFKQSCQYTVRNGVYGYYCDQVYRCDQVWTCSDRYECWQEYGCENEYVNRFRTTCVGSRLVYALEWEQVVDLGAVVAGVTADFILVNVYGQRTGAGSSWDYGTFVSAVPGTNFMCQGSAVLESAFETGGASWMQRIMSVYCENGRIKVKFKHSNRYIQSRRTQQTSYRDNEFPVHANPGPDYTSSSFAFNFIVYIGKFN